MIYLRLTYDSDRSEPEEHPIIEISNGELKSNNLVRVVLELNAIFKEDFLKKADLRFRK